MSRVVSIHQPAFMPWLGYLHRITVSDVHVVLDHVQFEKNSFINRNRIRTAEGWSWLTVPVRTKGKFGELPIHELETAEDSSWRRKHLASFKQHLGKAPHFAKHLPFLESLYEREWPLLAPLASEILDYLLKDLAISTEIVRSSELNVGGNKQELVLNLCRELGATVYYSGNLGQDYLDANQFEREGIRLIFQEYQHPTYPQAYPGFEPFMNAFDLLSNVGNDSRAMLLESNLNHQNLIS